MKVNVNINSKIGQPNFGSFGAGVSIELEIDQAALAKPDDVLAQIRFAGDLARAAVERELDLQRRHGNQTQDAPRPREAGSDDDIEPGDPAYERGRPGGRRDDREPETEERRSNRDDRSASYRERFDDRDRGRSEYRGNSNGNGDRRGGGGRDDREPTTGRQLFGWAKDRDTLSWFTKFGKSRNYPYRMNDWTDDDVADAMHEYHAKAGPTSRAASNGEARRN